MNEHNATMRDQVLSAVRAAMSNSPELLLSEPYRSAVGAVSTKQRPLMPLFMALLDAASAVAFAIEDNAWDDSEPISKEVAESLASQAYKIGASMISATQCSSSDSWSLPSMTKKELI